MAEFFAELSGDHCDFITRQPVFFVATAAPTGRVNLSPKGYDALRILGPKQVAYLDLAGSGNETHTHLAVDDRITLMLCNFEQPALILRIYGRGRAVLPQDDNWADLAAHFTILPGTRQIFVIDIDQVQTSCGYGVPFMSYERERDTLVKYHGRSDPVEWVAKQQGRNRSIDGLPVRTTDRYLAGDQGTNAD